MTSKQLKIEYVKIDTVKPWDRNPKLHNMQAIISSMDTFDITQPILVQRKSGRIIAGHGRLEAMKARGVVDVPIIRLDMTDEEAKAYALVDNQTVIAGGWDVNLMAELLGEIKIELPDIDMGDFGFYLSEYDLPVDIIEDEVPAIPKVATSERGQVYRLGNHRLMCGDATSKEDVAKLMDGKKADMVFTDPPYAVSIGKKNRDLQSIGIADRNTDDLSGDDLSVDEISESLWKPAFTNISEVLKDGSGYYVTAPQGGDQMMMMMMKSSMKCRHELIWVKSSPTFSMGRLDYSYQHEPILYGWKGTNRRFYGVNERSVWNIAKATHSKMHPTMKPIELVAKAIINSSRANEIVLDVFGGSGSTLIACEQLNRVCYMMEIDPIYIDVIIERWQNLTGKKAELVN